MRLHRNRHVEIAWRTAVLTVLTLVGQAEPHPRFDSGGNVDGQGAFSIDPLPASAGSTGVRNNLAASLALVAGSTDAEETLLETELTGPFATGTGLQT